MGDAARAPGSQRAGGDGGVEARARGRGGDGQPAPSPSHPAPTHRATRYAAAGGRPDLLMDPMLSAEHSASRAPGHLLPGTRAVPSVHQGFAGLVPQPVPHGGDGDDSRAAALGRVVPLQGH